MQEINILNEGYNYGKLASISKGSIIKINNKSYIDLSYSAGSIILGHSNKIFKKILNEISKKKIYQIMLFQIYMQKNLAFL